MKILYLCRSLNMGGIEKNLVLIAEQLKSTPHKMFVGAKPGVVNAMLTEQGAHCVDFYFNIRNPFTLLSDAKKLLSLVKTESIDVVHTFSAAPGVALTLTRCLAWISRYKKFPPTVSSIMGLQEKATEKAWVTHLRNFLTVLGARKIFIISPEIRRFMEKLPIAKRRLQDLHLVGVKLPDTPITESTQALKQYFGITTPNLVVTIGHLSPRKNHELFIQAANKITAQRQDTTFLIVGEGPDRAALQHAIDQTGSNHIRLYGLCKDIPKLLTITTVCVKPGILEGFIGITVLEAQTMNVPVVAFETTDVKLAIEAGVSGLIAKKADTEELARKIQQLLNQPALAKRIAQQGKKTVERDWSIVTITQNLLAEYQRLLP